MLKRGPGQFKVVERAMLKYEILANSVIVRDLF